MKFDFFSELLFLFLLYTDGGRIIWVRNKLENNHDFKSNSIHRKRLNNKLAIKIFVQN
jgi:hypothetical protein